MTSYDRRLQILAACLSALAGYVDAIGFLSLNGYFVSFMSGNSTQMAVGIAQGAASALIAAALVAVFVLGVMAGSVTAALAKAQRRPAVLVLVSLLLAAATCGVFGGLKLSIVCMTLAMGAENAVFERDGEVHVGVTYMTGTLVKLGQRLTAAALGGTRFGWVPYLGLWLGLVAGAVGGAIAYPHLGLGGLWLAAAGAAALAYAAYLIG